MAETKESNKVRVQLSFNLSKPRHKYVYDILNGNNPDFVTIFSEKEIKGQLGYTDKVVDAFFKLVDLLQKQPSYDVAEKIISTLSDKTEDVLYNKLAPNIEEVVAGAVEKALRNKVLSASNDIDISEDIKEDTEIEDFDEWNVDDDNMVDLGQNQNYNKQILEGE